MIDRQQLKELVTKGYRGIERANGSLIGGEHLAYTFLFWIGDQEYLRFIDIVKADLHINPFQYAVDLIVDDLIIG